MAKHRTDEKPIQLTLRREDCPAWLVRMVETGHRNVVWYCPPPGKAVYPLPRRRHGVGGPLSRPAERPARAALAR